MKIGTSNRRGLDLVRGLLAPMLSLSVLASAARGETFEIPPGDAAAIQNAIDQAVDGDIIQLQAGTYSVGATIDPGGKAITLRGHVDGDGHPDSILAGTGAGRILQCIAGEAEGTRLERLVITGGSADRGGGLLLVRSRPSILECVFIANAATDRGGAVAMTAAEAVFTGCRFESNTVEGDGGGLAIDSGDLRLVDCLFVANHASGDGGAIHQRGGVGHFDRCRFQDNGAEGLGGGLACRDFATSIVTDGVIRDNRAAMLGGGFHIASASVTLTGSTVCGNTGIQIAGPWSDGGGNGVADACEDRGGVVVVPVGPASAIQQAIDDSPAGTTIELQAGVYPILATLETRGRAIRILGAVDLEGRPATILDGGGKSQVLRIAGGETRSARLENLVVRGGAADDGAGAECRSSSPTFANCRFEDNAARRFGGGVHLFVSDARFERCEFIRNDAGDRGGAVSVLSGDPEVAESSIQDNFGRDAIHVQVGEIRLVDTTICGNSGLPVSGEWIEEGDCTIGTVCPDGGDSFDVALGTGETIQKILDAAPAGSEIRLAAGTYIVTQPLDVRGRALTIRGSVDGSGAPATFLDGSDVSRVLTCETGETGDTIFEDLVVRHGRAEHGAGTSISAGAAPTFRRCRFESNVATGSGGAIRIADGGGVFLDCEIVDNIANSLGGGFAVDGTAAPVRLDGVRISRNHAVTGAGISIADGHVEMAGTVVCANSAGQVNGEWIDLGGNTIDIVCPSEGGVIDIAPGDVEGLLAALVGAPDGTEIRLGSGRYLLPTPVDPRGHAIRIVGATDAEGGPASILDGEGKTQLIQCIAGEGEGTRFENLMLVDGRAPRGGAVILTRSQPTFVNCHLIGNRADFDGGAVMANASSPRFEQCLIESNEAMNGVGGGMLLRSGTLTIVETSVLDNLASGDGGGLHVTDGGAMLATGLTLRGNESGIRGGGLAISNDGWAEIDLSIVRENSAAAVGGVMAGGASLAVAESQVCGNTGGLQILGDWSDLGGNEVAEDCSDRGDVVVVEPGDGDRIQQAIASLGNGAVIQLQAGVYDLTQPIDPLGRGITIEGAVDSEGRPLSVLDAGGRCGGLSCGTGETSSTVFRNLRFVGGLAAEGAAARIVASSPTFENCEFAGNIATQRGGALHLEQSDSVLLNCSIVGNRASGDGGGIHVLGGEPSLVNAVVRDNPGLAGITVSAGWLSLQGTIVCGNGGEQIAGRWTDEGGNSVTRACEGEGEVIQVVAGPGALLQQAIDAAVNGDVIQIGVGIVSVTETIDLRGKAVRIQGTTGADGSPRTVLQGSGEVRLMVCRSGESAATVIQDIELRGGSATQGGGLLLDNGAAPLIRGCHFVGNAADLSGGAIHATLTAGSVDLIGCRFEGNSAASGGAVSLLCSSSPWAIQACTFESNTASFDGGAISAIGTHRLSAVVARENTAARRGGAFSIDGDVDIEQCDVSDNVAGDRGGGAILSGMARIVGSRWERNEAEFGGGLHLNMQAELLDTVVQANIAGSWGGGLVCNGDVTIVGSIVSENRSDSSGGGVRVEYGSTEIASGSVCRNLPDQISGNWTDGGEASVTEECAGYSSPDLEVVSLTPDILLATTGETVGCGWSIRNTGGSIAIGPWRQRMLITDDPLSGDTINAGEFTVVTNLNPQFTWDGGEEGVSVVMPSEPGNYWIALQVDIDNAVAEFGGEGNNRSEWVGPIEVTYPPAADLVSEIVDFPVTAFTGESVRVEWITRNQGERSAGPFWTDSVRLNRTQGYGQLLTQASVEMVGPVAGGVAAEPASAMLTMPTSPGEVWLHVRTDVAGEIVEYAGESNNLSEIFGPITVSYPPHPDFSLGRVAVTPTTVPGGESVTVTWQACNIGDLATSGFWVDRIYLSDDASPGGDQLLGEFVRAGTIEPGLCVDYSETVELPLLASGLHHIVVRADAAEQIFEGEGDEDDSNVAVSNSTIDIVEPPLADLGISSVVIPAEAIAGSEIEVVWFGANEGQLAAGPTWTDRLYLSVDDQLDPSDLNITDRFHVGAVSPGGTWTDSVPVVLPDTQGFRYVIVEADGRNVVVEGSGEGGNWKASATPIEILAEPDPNLVPEILAVPETAVAGDVVQISWRVRNEGAGVADGYWSDAVYLSEDATLDSGDRLLRLQPKAGPIAAGSDYLREYAVELPVDYVSGPRRLIVKVDRDGELVEESDSDNLAVSTAFFVAKTPAADLAVFDVAFEESELEFGSEFDVSFRVENLGDEPTSVAWSDLVLISADAVVNTGDLPIATAFREADPLPAGESYEVTVTCELPLTNDYPDGVYRIIVVGDVSDAVPEPDDTNNRAFSPLVPVSRPPLGDLRVDVLGMPLDVLPIEPFEITLRYSNDGEASITGNWYTSITLIDQNGGNPLLLQEFITAQDIPAGGFVDVPRSVQVPDRPDSEIALRVEVDSRDSIVEFDELNNRTTSSPASYRRPDLVPFGVALPDFAYAGEQIEVTIEGRNEGSAPAYAAWVDLICLSDDDILGADRCIGSGVFGQPVPAGGTFRYTISVVLPDDLEGDFHPVLRVDTGNQLLELDDENPPLLDPETTITIAVPDRPNLVPEGLSLPSIALGGSMVDVSYTVTNAGLEDAMPAWIDRLWFSRTPQVTEDSIQVAKLVRTEGVAEGAAYQDVVSVSVPGSPGSWYLILEVDAVNTLRESVAGETDNRLVAATPLQVQGVAATAWFVEDEIWTGDPLTIRGHATIAGTNEPAVSTAIRLRPDLRGFPTVISVQTDAEGTFETTWSPDSSLGGRAVLRVATLDGDYGEPVDEAVVWGLAMPSLPAVSVTPGGVAPLVFDLRNLTDLPVTGVTLSPELPSGTEDVSMELDLPGSDVLAPDETRTVIGSVQASEESMGMYAATIHAESVEAGSISRAVEIEVVAATPTLVSTPARLQADAVLDQVSYTDVTIRNIGLGTTGALEVLLSNFEFAELVGAPQIPALEPGAEATVSIRLAVSGDLTQGSYTASPGLVVRDPADPGVFAAVDVEFNVTSASYATIEVQATSEFSYFGVPPVHPEATVEITRDADGVVVAAGVVDDEGRVRFERLEPGVYRIRSTADRHGTFSTLVNAQGGQVNAVEAFMPRTVLSYVWDVVPIEFTDEYIITLSLTYETNVPAPVVTIDPIVLDFSAMTAPTQAVELQLTNHGLITASNVRWGVSNTDRLQIIPLNPELGDIAPGATITTSVLLVDQEFNAGGVAGSGGCDPSIGVYYECYCGGETRVSSVPMGVVSPPQQCGGDIYLPPSSPPPSGGGGGAVDVGNVSVPPQETAQEGCPCEDRGAQCVVEAVALQYCLTGLGAQAALRFVSGPAGLLFTIGYGVPCAILQLSVLGDIKTWGDLGDISGETLIETLNCFLPLLPQCLCDVGSLVDTCFCLQTGLPCGPFGAMAASVVEDIVSPAEDPDRWLLPDNADLLREGLGEDDTQASGLFGGISSEAYQSAVDASLVVMRIQRPVAYILGSWDWIDFGGSEDDQVVAGQLVSEMIGAISEASNEGSRVSESERSAIMALPRPSYLSPEVVDAALVRFNRTVDYHEQGWYAESDVPAGLSVDFIDFSRLGLFAEAAEFELDRLVSLGHESMYGELVEKFNVWLLEIQSGPEDDQDGQGQCVQIELELEQRLAVTREAFEARLELTNEGDSYVDGIRVDVDIKAADGTDASDRFAVLGPEVTGMGNVSGSGVLEPGETGNAVWTLVPGDSAAPDGMVPYWVSGEIVYTLQGQVLSIPLYPVMIEVHPNASLELQYFIESPVIGDDPFTPEIEPSVPFSLGLWMKNNGAGVAGDVRIESGQPEIVGATSGGVDTEVLIDFLLIGSEVDGEPISPSLDVSFGDIGPEEVGVARWLMVCSLQGEFTGYSATVQSVNGFDDPEFSIVDAIDINRLEHVVRGDEPIDDGIPDFLVDLVADADDLPDTVFLSSTAVEPVVVAVDPPISTGGGRTATIEAGPAGSWRFIRIEDPFNAAYRLSRVVRGDGKVLQLGFNAWQVDYIDRSTPTPTPRRWVKIFDRGGDGVYHLEFDTDATPPSLLTWRSMKSHGALGPVGLDLPMGSPASEPRGPVSTLVVTFDEPVDPDTISAASVALTGLHPDGSAIDPDLYQRSLSLGAGAISATIGFDPPLPPGRYCIRLVGVTDQAGNYLDGETSRLDLGVTRGDVTGDLIVDVVDSNELSNLIGTTEIDRFDPWEVRADLDLDGDIDLDDADIVTANRPTDHSVLITTCTLLNLGEKPGGGGPFLSVATASHGALLGGQGKAGTAADGLGGRPGSGFDATQAFEEMVGPTVPLDWADDAFGKIAFPVILDRIAVRADDRAVDVVAALASLGIDPDAATSLSPDGWYWARLPSHLGDAAGHAFIGARLAARGLIASPVVAVEQDRIMVAHPSVLLAFDPLVPSGWDAKVVEQVSPGARLESTPIDVADQWRLRSGFGGDAIADAGAFRTRQDVMLAEPLWRFLVTPPGEVPSPPVSAAGRRWLAARADLDGDGRVSSGELDSFAAAAFSGEYHPRFDLNGDGAVDMLDFVEASEGVAP